MCKTLLIRITEAMLILLAMVVIFSLIMLYVGNTFWQILFASDELPVLRMFLSVAALLALWILGELFMVIRTVRLDPFTKRNVAAFFRMGAVSELAALLFSVLTFIRFTPMTFAMTLVLLLAGLFAFVLAQVFSRAVEYKLETDLTI